MTMLSVVIPAYNEEDGIAAIVDRVLAIEPEPVSYTHLCSSKIRRARRQSPHHGVPYITIRTRWVVIHIPS